MISNLDNNQKLKASRLIMLMRETTPYEVTPLGLAIKYKVYLTDPEWEFIRN